MWDEVSEMLSNEARNLLVKTYQIMPDAGRVAEIFFVSVNSVYRLVRQMRDTGSVELQTSSRGRKASLSTEDVERIRKAIEKQPDITIHEIRVNLNLPVSDETVRTKVLELDYGEKNISRVGKRPGRYYEKREWWKEWQKMMWKVKSILRGIKERTADTLTAAIQQAMNLVTPEDCRGWFRGAGYFC